MILLFSIPLLLIGLGVLMMSLGIPYIHTFTGIMLTDYSGYIVAMLFLLTGGMLGTVTGFMMLDDKDASIYELMSITPLGREGYLYNRLAIPILVGCLYCLAIWLVFPQVVISGTQLLIILTFVAMEIIIIGMILFDLAEDKVKGLTYAKGMNIFLLLPLVDLIDIPILQWLSRLFPTYWVGRIIVEPRLLSILCGVLVHILWVMLLVGHFYRKKG